ncbi:MAG: arylsulfatase [Candidatus Latescibacteria bacterium]|jgi:arylsulfatase A-like enzyme|nr:arylsulfatase [Candidatus Latescibacterota bacterium]
MSKEMKHPNIVIMYADDLGFGDVGCYGATSIPTPNIDRLASEGIRFTQGYATAATCTPSRYSLLTGSYPWRNPSAAILPGDAPIIIDPESPTLPGMLRNAGYRTGVVGKWHLGLGQDDLDWNREISATPNDVGFDCSFIMAATNDRVPCVYVEDRKVVGLDPEDPIEVTYDWDKAFPEQPTGRHNPELLRMNYSHGHDASIVNGVSRIGHMRGGQAALWEDETMAEIFSERAVEYVTENKDGPFFLYYAFHQPHVPRLPGPRFRGSTVQGVRGDVIVEMDWCVGEMLDALERLGIRQDTLVIFSSDNGPVLDDGYEDRAEELKGPHKAAGPLRGGKYSMFDGGTRVPFIVSWPGRVEPGESAALACHADFYASFAALTGQTLEDDEAPDSMDVLDALLGKSKQGRSELVVEGRTARTVLRQDDWVFIPPYDGPAMNVNTNTELGNSPEPQLYDLSQDVGQIRNLAADHCDIVDRMSAQLESILAGERTRHP